jgi:hypothetical protein
MIRQKFIDFNKAWIDEPLLSLASRFSSFSYRTLGIPHPELRLIVRVISNTILFLGGVFQMMVADADHRMMAYSTGASGIMMGLMFGVPAIFSMSEATMRWDARRYKQALATASFHKTANLKARLVLFWLMVSCLPLIAFQANMWEAMVQYQKIVFVGFLVSLPFSFLSDFLHAAEPPKPDDGDTFATMVPRSC